MTIRHREHYRRCLIRGGYIIEMNVGVRQLEHSLSRCLRAVRDGEVVLVTERGRVDFFDSSSGIAAHLSTGLRS